MKLHGDPPADAAWKGETHAFPAAAEFERACIKAAADGALVLCATARLARRLLHGYRLARKTNGDTGWETPQIQSFRGWVNAMHDRLWSPCRPLTTPGAWQALYLWHKAVGDMPPPDGLIIQPALYAQLQSALDALQDTGLDPVKGDNAHPLSAFRRSATRRFLELAKQEGAASWRDVLSAVRQAVADGHPLPARIVFAGFDPLSPLEQSLAAALAARSKTVLWRAAAEPDASVRVRVFAAPEQECRAVCADVLRTWNGGRKNLGVVFADRAYFSILKHCFDELAGLERPDFEKAVRYNLTVGTPLAEHPLFQTASLPLRLAAEPEPGPLLTSLLVSPYVRAPGWDAQPLRAALWETDHILTLAEALRALEKHGIPVRPLRKFSELSTASLADWVAGLQACLNALGFCRFDGQYRATDALARQHLDTIMTALAQDAGDIETDGPGTLAWLTAAAESVIVAEKTPETAGIQVLSPSEARGLAFDRLWVVGAHGAALPPPAREWPFLDPDEQRRMEDGTIEQQWENGRRRLTALQAAAPEVNFSRAAANGEEAPYLPCPMIPDKTDANNQPAQEILNLWEDLSAEWMRARWLRDGYCALRSAGTKPALPPSEPGLRPLTGAWNVTAIEDLTACPFLFFCGRMLKLEPLALADAGIDPRVRGQVLHAILKTFMDGLAAHIPDWPNDSQAALKWLTQTVDQALARWPRNIFWRVERRRLLGDEQNPGVLAIWLEQERQRALAGWRVTGTEMPFEGLPVAGITLKGRIDRIDRHPTEGLAVWDYKSGGVPAASSVISLATEIQLPAYLLALQRGLIPELGLGSAQMSNCRSNERPLQHPGVAAVRSRLSERSGENCQGSQLPDMNVSGVPLQAGYIGLKKASEVKIATLSVRRQPVNWNEYLPVWEATLDQRLAAPRQGRFAADPRPAIPVPFHRRGGPCQFCEFFNLCGYFDCPAKEPDDEDGNQEL